MGLNCGCPITGAISDITKQECKTSMGQVQKLLFQRRFNLDATPVVLNEIAAASIVTKTAWQTLLAATDSTKVTVSPEISNPETEPGAARTFGGGDNTTVGGMPIITGRESTAFTSSLYELDQAIIKQLKTYQCEDISVFFIDEYGNIGCLVSKMSTGATPAPTHYKGVPVRSFFVGDKKLGGFNDPDSNALNFSLEPNWSDDLVVIKRESLDFNPLTDL